jgi:hypothetical protein
VELPDKTHDAATHSKSSEPLAVVQVAPLPETSQAVSGFNRAWLIIILLVTALNVAIWGISWKHKGRPVAAPSSILPWSVFLNSPHAIQLITSDPDIAEIQQYNGGEISVSDYANHHVIPNPDNMTPEVRHFWDVILRDDKAASVDTQIAVSIAEMAQANSKDITVRAARSIQMSDL